MTLKELKENLDAFDQEYDDYNIKLYPTSSGYDDIIDIEPFIKSKDIYLNADDGL